MTSSGADHALYGGVEPLRPYPITPHLVASRFYCTYRFQGARGQRILLRLSRLKVGHFDERTKSCSNGYLRLWDGTRIPGMYRYPPNTLCGDYDSIHVLKFSTDTVAEVEFFAERAERGNTFELDYQYVNLDLEAASYPKQIWHHMKLIDNAASVCTWEIYVDDCDGICPVLSPGYPGTYPPNTECRYHITSLAENVAIQLDFHGAHDKPREFDIKESPGCVEEYVEVYEGRDEASGALIGRFCGRSIPRVTVSSNHVFMVFLSSPDMPPYGHAGFHASAIAVTHEWQQNGQRVAGTHCDWVFNSSEGSMSSPDYWLPRRAACTYSFHVASGNYMQLILHIYGLRSECKDRIEVYEAEHMIARLCENSMRESDRFVYNLTQPEVVVKYFLHDGQMEAQPDKGFWMSFRQVQALQSLEPPKPDLDRQQSEYPTPPSDAVPLSGARGTYVTSGVLYFVTIATLLEAAHVVEALEVYKRLISGGFMIFNMLSLPYLLTTMWFRWVRKHFHMIGNFRYGPTFLPGRTKKLS